LKPKFLRLLECKVKPDKFTSVKDRKIRLKLDKLTLKPMTKNKALNIEPGKR